MRREILFSLFGFLGGFVVAGVVFWQPVAPRADAPVPSSADQPNSRGTSTAGAPVSEHGRRPVVVAAGQYGVSAPVAEGTPQA